jgi:DUF4097 and DUF4098 domain-containing protein YvlB
MKAVILGLAIATASLTGFDNTERQRDIDQHFKVTPSQRVEISGFSGSQIRFRSWEKSEVYFKLTVSISSSREQDEQKYLNGVSLKSTESTDALIIRFEEPDFLSRSHSSFWSWLESIFSGSLTSKRIEGEVYVPRANALIAEVRYGSISLDGMTGPLEVRGTGNTIDLKNCSAIQEVANDFGNVTIERSGGALRLSSKSSTITLDQFNGKAAIDADYSNITVRDMTQSLTLHSASATIKVDRVGGNASIRSNYSKVTANDISGVLEIEDQSGTVRARNVGGIRIDGLYSTMEVSDVSGKGAKEITMRGQSGPIYLARATGALKIDNPYGNVDLREIRGNVDLKSKSSRITADDVSGEWFSETEYSSYSVRRLTSKRVTMTNKSGKIDLDLSSLPSLVDIRNEYADVDIEMPEGFKGDVDIDVTYGKLETNLPLLKNRPYRESGGYRLRVPGDGRSKLSIETKSGNVSVMQR